MPNQVFWLGFHLKTVMKKSAFLFLAALFFNSCIIQFVNSNCYNDLDPSLKQKIHKLESFDETLSGHVYEINGKQLMNQLKTKKKSLVYIFSNGCDSDYCLPLSNIEDYAQENDLTLFLIMSSYYKIEHTISQNVGSPLYAIDSDTYHSNKTRVYQRKFKEEIDYYNFLEKQGEKWMGNHLFYVGDSLVEIKK